MKTVLFYDPNLNERGTSITTYDYAHFNETILGNRSIIVSRKDGELKSFDKFNSRFPTYLVTHLHETYELAKKEKCEYYYALKYGFNDNNILPDIKNLVHVVFPSFEPHGDVYAYISKWLAKNHGNNFPYVPHMVNLPNINEDYKEYFNTKNKLVVGWYGGNNFELPFAKQAVIDVATKRKDIMFLFMNSDQFCNLDNVLFIDGTTDQEQKVAFINTCDMMIHARERGETFGLAIAEFSSKNKPVITYKNSPEQNHIDILGEKGIYYTDYNSLYNILTNIKIEDLKKDDWNCYQEYTPENVMNQFNKIFLK